MDDDWLAKIAKNEKPKLLGLPGRPPKVGAKVGHQRYIKNRTWSYKKMRKKKIS